MISGISILLFLIPSFIAAVRWLGRRDALILFGVLGAFALAIETIAISTGFPYGDFFYSDHLGYKILGVVPWTVAFAWTPLILAAYGIAAQLTSKVFPRIIFVALALVVFDLVLDPGAVRMGFWGYTGKAWYYGVPWSNYFGWLFSGLIGAAILEFTVRRFRPLLPVPVKIIESGFLTVIFWTCIAGFGALYIPFIIGLVVIAFLALVYSRSVYEFDDMVVLVDEDNNAVGTARKLPVHSANTPLHRAFSVFLFNESGELLIQQRALNKKTWGGVWSNSACGHVMLHESVVRAAKRRLKHELGLKADILKVILPDFRYRAEKDGVVENEICPVLVGFIDEKPKPNPDEVNDYEWVSWESFLEDSRDENSEFSPWAREEAILLDQNKEFREFLCDNTNIYPSAKLN